MPVETVLGQGRDVLFDIDWQGFRQLKAALPGDVVGVFIRPPSMAALRQRLVARGDAEADVERRMAHAEAEMAHAGEFDHVVENADFELALAALRGLLKDSRAARGAKNIASA
jgi:guanylate kinase